ncbi:MAG: mechanosensitive ion channel domain-containing protein [Paracoccus sp. (in: a-proteobacteria)]|uniref:mechanosensitive ion channel domain-containing protein n=2 Tax=Paracoccus sp. TaxID=267 RepID=UPI0040593638
MRHLLATILVALLMMIAGPSLAQQATPLNYDAWEQVAEDTEELASNPQATNEELAAARERIVEWRGRLEEGQSVNAERITTLRNQIQSLGPVPAEGETEDPDVAARRAELNQQLSTAQAPRLAAVEAESRASSIIAQIDEIIRRRQALELMKVSPSPLLPASLRGAVGDGLTLLDGIVSEVSGANATPETWADLRPRLPVVLLYLAGAVLILTLGRSWIGSLPSRLSVRASHHSRAVLAFVVSLGQIVIPMIGVYLAISAIKATGLPGPWTTPILNALPGAAVILFGGIWMARALFPRQAIAYTSLQMSEAARASAGRMVNTLALLMAVHYILSRAVLPLSGLYERGEAQVGRVPVEFSEGAAGVWHLVMAVLAAMAMVRLGNVLRRLTRNSAAQDQHYRDYIASWAGVLTRIAGPLAVLVMAVGYVNLGNLLIWPWILSLALIGLLILLQDFIADVFEMFYRGAEGARDGLAPLLIGFALVLLSVPLFLMIWGATPEALAEYWVAFRNGISLGGVTLSPGAILTFLVIFAVGYLVTRGVQGAFRNSILPKTKLDAGGQNAVISGLGYVGIVLAAILAITSAGIDLSAFAIVAGALSVGIGFGLQNIVSNFVSGIILLIERPVSVGDWVSAGGQQGIVKKISVRATMVETFDKTEVIVPNSDFISQPVTNWTRHNKVGRIIIPVGVAYGTDTRKVERILREIAEDHPLVSIDPAPAILFRGLGADSLDFEIRAILGDVGTGLGVTSDLLHEIVRRFEDEGIEIPFAQRDIWLRNPEALPGAATLEKSRELPSGGPSRPDPSLVRGDADAAHGLPDDGGDAR